MKRVWHRSAAGVVAVVVSLTIVVVLDPCPEMQQAPMPVRGSPRHLLPSGAQVDATPAQCALLPAAVDAGSADRHPASPLDAATDPEWPCLPRVTKDVLGRLLQTQQCDPIQLYRSQQFNPRDIWLSPGARAAIAAIHSTDGTQIERLRAVAVAVKDTEFSSVHAAGKTLPVVLKTLDGQANLRRVGSSPVFGVVDGCSLAVSLAELPRTAAADRSLRQAAAELAGRLAAAFADHGALEPAELEALCRRIH